MASKVANNQLQDGSLLDNLTRLDSWFVDHLHHGLMEVFCDFTRRQKSSEMPTGLLQLRQSP